MPDPSPGSVPDVQPDGPPDDDTAGTRPEQPERTEQPRDEVDLEAMARDLAAVESALARLDDGTYGRCAVCDAEIGDDRLATDPVTTVCAAHS